MKEKRMNTKWTPARIAGIAVVGLLALMGAWLFIGSVFWLVREFAGEQPAPVTENGRVIIIALIGALVSIVSVTFGVSLTQKGDDSQRESVDDLDGVQEPMQWESDEPTPDDEAPLDEGDDDE